MENDLRRIRSIADYQFGENLGVKLFSKNVQIEYSKKTGRIRYVYLDNKRLATLRPTDGLFSLSIAGAKRIAENAVSKTCFVSVQDDVSKFIADGGDVFAVHIVEASDKIRPKDEIIVINESSKVLAVGRATLSGAEMKVFKVGVAVKVRRGCIRES